MNKIVSLQRTRNANSYLLRSHNKEETKKKKNNGNECVAQINCVEQLAKGGNSLLSGIIIVPRKHRLAC